MAHHLTRSIPTFFAVLALLMTSLQLSGCSKPTLVDGKAVVNLDGTDYSLTIVADDATRERGLGGVESLPENGGMLFVFPDSRLRAFVMRDCLIDIDIIFLDPSGRIVAMHHMPVEPQQTESENAVQYENRLKRYSSRFSAQYAIEIAGGKLKAMNLQEGQLINLDTEYLQSIVQ
ncbi:MAG: DUF192 domain-containing protein [Phycisphaerales bacterium]